MEKPGNQSACADSYWNGNHFRIDFVTPEGNGQDRADALVLVNSTSASYDDFQHYIQPYLDNFGVPYTVLDIATQTITSDVGDYAVIIVGHRQLDPDGLYLDTSRRGLHLRCALAAEQGW